MDERTKDDGWTVGRMNGQRMMGDERRMKDDDRRQMPRTNKGEHR